MAGIGGNLPRREFIYEGNVYYNPDCTTEYRGFKLKRDSQYMLWEIVSGPNETPVPHALKGKFTKMMFYEATIDTYLKDLEKTQAEQETRVTAIEEKNNRKEKSLYEDITGQTPDLP